MFRFIRNLVAIVIVAVIVVVGGNSLYEVLGDLQGEKSGYGRFKNVPQDVEVSFFGSSHACAFVSDDILKYEAFNFGSQGWQTLSYDHRIMQAYGKNIDDKGLMFVTLSYFTFKNNEEEQENFLSKNQRYYLFLPKKYIKNYNFQQATYAVLPALALGDYPYDLIVKLKERVLPMPEPHTFGVAAHLRANQYITTCQESFDGEIQALYDIISFCEERDITPVLITTPIHQTLHDALDELNPNYKRDFYNMAAQVVSETNLRYYDYSSHPQFINSEINMRDIDHLSTPGATLFTQIVYDEIISKYDFATGEFTDDFVQPPVNPYAEA